MNDETFDYSDAERRLLASLPTTSDPDASGEERLVSALRREGFFRQHRWWTRADVQLAAAIVLLLVGGMGGSYLARRNSLEVLLSQEEMPIADRVLLMQRAGSAYVRAAQAYADAAKTVDSTAVEVASQVLIGAAQAVARTDLDGGLSPRLTNLLQTARVKPTTESQRVIWY